MLSGVILSFIAIMRFWPSTRIARSLHELTVEAPASRLSRLERHHLFVVVIVAVMLAGGLEVIAAFGSFDALLLFSFDLSLYLDAMGALLAVAAVDRVKPALLFLHSRLVLERTRRTSSSPQRQAREVRSRRAQCVANNDDEPARAGIQAA